MNLSKEKDRLKQYILWEKCLWVSEEALLCVTLGAQFKVLIGITLIILILEYY